MEYICLNCGRINESLTCPNCHYTISEEEYNEIIEKAQETIRYGYYYRKEAENNLNIHYDLLSPTNYLEWIAAAVLANVSYDLVKYLAIRIYNYIKDNLTSNEKQYSRIIDILNDETKFQEFIKYLQEYKDGLATLEEDKKKYIEEEILADFMGNKAAELYQKEKRVPNAQDILSFLKEGKEKDIFSIKPQNNIRAFLFLKEE
nr:MAG TPA_asm: DNA-directed RNA polymerase [Caudoviricetes sp.]